ncbi:hypothetical protein GGE43_005190 [Agrobacterium tumefaciens]|uniref:Uncharacterized protein n=1 Tax=Agrobacterium radiobacter TaxID=362 RepID=A0ABR6JEN5_AGRRD|nr:hypothetical protein [Agrobacterium radiobacter]CUX52339.1 hypothetical protein AGR4B_pAt20005 [Agrobacterium tumefaciens str. CFBP 5621]MBB4338460.1 hypothetical protein [Agrobacterium radiobacter]MBB4493402.1 hypothetical protein [Agrobacterium radiobacter]MBB4498619.1 hypothetical protein [Agrobacterium radiobacter]
MTGIDRIPAAAKTDFAPSAEIHRVGVFGHADITETSDLDSVLAHTNLSDDNDGFGYTLSVEGGKRMAVDPPGQSHRKPN